MQKIIVNKLLLAGQQALVVQSNFLIESRYTLTAGEQKIVLAMTSLINKDDKDFKEYTFKVIDLSHTLNINIKNAYRDVDEITDRLMKRILYIREKEKYLKIHWVSSCLYNKDEGTITFRFDPGLKPYLLQLKEQFTQYNLSVASQFQSSYTIRIYGLLKQYELIGLREIDLSELKNILGIKENEYKEFKYFKKRVLNQAKKEFEKKSSKNGAFLSDISFDLETIRTGRKITRLKFIIKKQVYQESLKFNFPNKTKLKEEPEIIQRLKHYGLTIGLAEHFLDKNGEDSINDTLKLYEERLKQKKVEDKKGGYLVKLLQDQAGVESPHEKEQKEVEQARKEAEIESEKKACLKKKKQDQARKKKREFLDCAFEALEEEKQAEIDENFKKSLLPIEKQMVEKYGVKAKMFIIRYYQFLSDHIII